MNLQCLKELAFDYNKKNPTVCEDASCVVKTGFEKKGYMSIFIFNNKD